MRIDYGDWKPARDKLIKRFYARAWRHGLKTRDAIREVALYGKFPVDPNTMWPTRWRKKNGNLLYMALYYFVQSGLKLKRFQLVGASGLKIRPRAIYNVEHGCGEDELDEDGNAPRPPKEGLWMFHKDMNDRDVQLVRADYNRRENDAPSDKVYMNAAHQVLQTKSSDTVIGDVEDEIARAI